MNTYHHYLKIPVKFTPVFDAGATFISGYDKTLINQELVEWISSLGLTIGGAEVFHLEPNDPNYPNCLPIHSDSSEFDDHVKMNFVYSDSAATMNWYEYKDADLLETLTTPIGTGYVTTSRDNCELVYSAEVGKPSLVNTGMLHDISPIASTRWCFSFPLWKNGRRLTWDLAVEIFKDFIIDNSN
jgi:hypothetical protein